MPVPVLRLGVPGAGPRREGGRDMGREADSTDTGVCCALRERCYHTCTYHVALHYPFGSEHDIVDAHMHHATFKSRLYMHSKMHSSYRERGRQKLSSPRVQGQASNSLVTCKQLVSKGCWRQHKMSASPCWRGQNPNWHIHCQLAETRWLQALPDHILQQVAAQAMNCPRLLI